MKQLFLISLIISIISLVSTIVIMVLPPKATGTGTGTGTEPVYSQSTPIVTDDEFTQAAQNYNTNTNNHNQFIPLLKYPFTTDAYGNTLTTIPSDKLNENYQKLKLFFQAAENNHYFHPARSYNWIDGNITLDQFYVYNHTIEQKDLEPINSNQSVDNPDKKGTHAPRFQIENTNIYKKPDGSSTNTPSVGDTVELLVYRPNKKVENKILVENVADEDNTIYLLPRSWHKDHKLAGNFRGALDLQDPTSGEVAPFTDGGLFYLKEIMFHRTLEQLKSVNFCFKVTDPDSQYKGRFMCACSQGDNDCPKWDGTDHYRYNNETKKFFTRFLAYNPLNAYATMFQRKSYIVVKSLIVETPTYNGLDIVQDPVCETGLPLDKFEGTWLCEPGFNDDNFYYDKASASFPRIVTGKKSEILYITIPLFVVSTSLLIFSMIKKNKFNNYNYII